MTLFSSYLIGVDINIVHQSGATFRADPWILFKYYYTKKTKVLPLLFCNSTTYLGRYLRFFLD